ncbi:hypothetical protein O6H91_04G010600 [Diphasiastrum complanatum]|uniref:Uncharacterized protein n=1 Tax=Diphasiastrum complanatum TaxID=34168 RepID=A0ACC2DUF1_DIPCM|nr:hypothetical protein O6H91_04G010600 [Diphasiastrum complanatum]
MGGAAQIARTVVGVAGNVISFGLFLSPMPTFVKIFRKKSTEQYSGVPYVCTLLNCLLWALYGMPFVTPHSTLVITINGCGILIESAYILVYLIYGTKETKMKVLKMLAVVIIFFGAVVALVLSLVHVHKKRRTIVGALCVVFGTMMYASPLSVMKLVITTKSVEYMPFLLSLASFVNGLIWTSYAFLGRLDVFIIVPNGIGSLLGALQLVIYFIYYKKPTEEEGTKVQDTPTSIYPIKGSVNLELGISKPPPTTNPRQAQIAHAGIGRNEAANGSSNSINVVVERADVQSPQH